MISVHLMEAEMDRMEVIAMDIRPAHGGLSLVSRIECEQPFISLSFLAKGVLSVALTIPYIFIDGRKFEAAPQICTAPH